MLVKVSYKKRKSPLGYKYTQRISVTTSLLSNLEDIIERNIKDKEKYSDLLPLGVIDPTMTEIPLTRKHLELLKDELEAHSARTISLDKPTVLFNRGDRL